MHAGFELRECHRRDVDERSLTHFIAIAFTGAMRADLDACRRTLLTARAASVHRTKGETLHTPV